MPSNIKYSEMKKLDFFKFFNLKEVKIKDISESKMHIKLKPGGFQEHIDIEFIVNKDELENAKIFLDRKWIGNAESINPFANDIAKSFLGAIVPYKEQESIRDLIHFLFNLKGNKDILIPCQKPYQYFEKFNPEVVPFLDVYRNRRDSCEFLLKNSKFIIQNTIHKGKNRLLIEWKKF